MYDDNSKNICICIYIPISFKFEDSVQFDEAVQFDESLAQSAAARAGAALQVLWISRCAEDS